jgi:hypothetical protein
MLHTLPGLRVLLSDQPVVVLLVKLVGLLDGDEEAGEVREGAQLVFGFFKAGRDGDEVVDLLLDLLLVAGNNVLQL